MRMTEGMFRRSVFILFIAAVTACSSTDNQVQQRPTADTMSVFKLGSYSSDSGSEAVGVIPEAHVRDAILSIEYPIKGGPYPLIVFERPAASSPRSYEAIAAYWTSYGYVSIRTPDVKLALDSLDELEQKFPELKGKFDRTRIGVGGHVANGAALAPADPRVKAVLELSPERTENVRKPVMLMTGADVKTNQPPPGRREAFATLSPGEKYFVEIQGAREASFGGGFTDAAIERETARAQQPYYDPNDPYGQRTMSRPADRSQTFERERRIIADIRIVSLAFWDAYLKENAKGREFLGSKDVNEGLLRTEKR